MSAASASVEPPTRGPHEASLIPDFEPRFPWWCPDFPNDGDLYARISVLNDSTIAAEAPRVRLLSITPDPLQKNHLPSDLIPKGLEPPKIVSPRSAPLYWDIFWFHEGEYYLATVEWTGAKLLLQPGQDYLFEVEVSAANAPTNAARFRLRLQPDKGFPLFAFAGATINLPRRPPRPLPLPPDAIQNVYEAGRPHTPQPVAPPSPSPDSDEGAVFKRRGDIWEVGLGARTSLLKQLKGLEYIHQLLLNPNRDIPVVNLVSIVEGHTNPGSPTLDEDLSDEDRRLTDSGATARALYREHLESLKADIEEADRDRDTERAATLREEFNQAAEAVKKALNYERRDEGTRIAKARSKVGKQVRGAIERVSELQPELGKHLKRSIQARSICSYRPDESLQWTL